LALRVDVFLFFSIEVVLDPCYSGFHFWSDSTEDEVSLASGTHPERGGGARLAPWVLRLALSVAVIATFSDAYDAKRNPQAFPFLTEDM
jgi:hypothetical protein